MVHPICSLSKARVALEKTHNSETMPEDYCEIELTPNPGYNRTTFATLASLYGESQPAEDNDAVLKGNVYVPTEEEPTYGNVLY